jgi:hypothetical protein
MALESVTSIDTHNPRYSPVEYTNTLEPIIQTPSEFGRQTVNDSISSITTILKIKIKQ